MLNKSKMTSETAKSRDTLNIAGFVGHILVHALIYSVFLPIENYRDTLLGVTFYGIISIPLLAMLLTFPFLASREAFKATLHRDNFAYKYNRISMIFDLIIFSLFGLFIIAVVVLVIRNK